MRLWHYKLIPFLPDAQLVAQWRELNSIFKKTDRHILINYIYEYDPSELMSYAELVIGEMRKRGFKVNTDEGSTYQTWIFNTFGMTYHIPIKEDPFEKHHNQRYLLQCFYNLQEKYDRGQKGFTPDVYRKLLDGCWKEYNKRS